jgi:hypothetical protein
MQAAVVAQGGTGSDRPRFFRFETACRARVGTRRLAELRQAVSVRLPIVGQTGKDAVGFYSASHFVITSLGEKYPGIECLRLHLDAHADGR